MVALVAASSFVLFHAARSLKLLRMMLPRTRVGNFGVKNFLLPDGFYEKFLTRKFITKICNTNIFRFTVIKTAVPRTKTGQYEHRRSSKVEKLAFWISPITYTVLQELHKSSMHSSENRFIDPSRRFDRHERPTQDLHTGEN